MGSVLYQLFVNGIPKPQPRPRVLRNGHVYNPKDADAWKGQVKAAFLACRKDTITGAVRLTVRFSLPLPKAKKMKSGLPEPHVKKPDTDNLLKAVMDAMTTAKVWVDDSQVYETFAGKYYTGRQTGAQIIVEGENE